MLTVPADTSTSLRSPTNRPSLVTTLATAPISFDPPFKQLKTLQEGARRFSSRVSLNSCDISGGGRPCWKNSPLAFCSVNFLTVSIEELAFCPTTCRSVNISGNNGLRHRQGDPDQRTSSRHICRNNRFASGKQIKRASHVRRHSKTPEDASFQIESIPASRKPRSIL